MEKTIVLKFVSFRLADSQIKVEDVAVVDDHTTYKDGIPVDSFCNALRIKVYPVHGVACVSENLIYGTTLDEFKNQLFNQHVQMVLGKDDENGKK